MHKIPKEKKKGKRKRNCENGIVNGENGVSEPNKMVSNEEEAPKKKKKKNKKMDKEVVQNETNGTVVEDKEAEVDDNEQPATGTVNDLDIFQES